MSRFDTALKFELSHECEYDNKGNVVLEHPDGRPTKYGMEQPDILYGLKNIKGFAIKQIADLDLKGASDLYYLKYWIGARANKLPAGFAEVVFDIAVNNGVHASAILLQRSLGLPEDGVVGPITIAATYNANSVTLKNLVYIRAKYYRDIVSSKPHLQGDLEGWINRNNDLAEFVNV